MVVIGEGVKRLQQFCITHYPLPITHYPLPITNYSLLINNKLLEVRSLKHGLSTVGKHYQSFSI